MMDIKLKGRQAYDPAGYPSKLTGVRKAPHKGLVVHLEVKLNMRKISRVQKAPQDIPTHRPNISFPVE
jgi:hypothetical protein